jgi:MFS family permease
VNLPAFRWLWLANTGFFAAMQMQQVAQGWLVYEMTGDPLSLGGVSAGTGIAMLVCSLFGGVLADRVVKRDLLIVTQACLALIALTIGALVVTGVIQYWHMLVASVVSGVVFAFNLPARQSIVPEVVGDKYLANAIALNASGMNLMRIAAPALAGGLLVAIGASGVYFSMMACYVFVVAMMLLVPRTRPSRTGRASVAADLREAARYLAGAPTVVALIGAEFVLVLVGMPYQMLLPVFAKDVFAVGPSGLGALLSAVGVGSLVGSLAVASLSRVRRRGLMLLGAGALFGIGLVGFALAPDIVVATICLGLAGIGNSAYFALNNALVMGIVDNAMRGRVMSVYGFTFGLQPLGAVPLSAIAGSLGAPVAVAVGGSLLVVGMVAFAVGRPAIRRLV